MKTLSLFLILILFQSCLPILPLPGQVSGDATITAGPAPINLEYIVDTEFKGFWSRCTNATTTSSNTKFSIDENVIIHITIHYAAKDCVSGTESDQQSTIYTYTESAGQLYLTSSSSVTLPLSTAMTNTFNANSQCGYASWSIGIPKNDLGTSCNSHTLNASSTAAYSRSGNTMTIVMGATSYVVDAVRSISITNRGEGLVDGNYYFTDGDMTIFFLAVSAGHYTLTTYGTSSLNYFHRLGVLASDSNVLTLTSAGSDPTPCMTDSGSVEAIDFKSGSVTDFFLKRDNGSSLMGEKVMFSEVDFRVAFLSGSFTFACF